MSYDDGNPFIEEIEITIRQEVQAGMSDYSYDQGEDNYYNNLLGRGKGDGDLHNPPGKPVEHVIEPENALWADMLKDMDLPNELLKEDIY